MYLATPKIALAVPLFLYVQGNSALPAAPTLLPPLPDTDIADSKFQGQDLLQHPSAPAQLHTRNLTLSKSILSDRFEINPSLIIIIDNGYPIPNSTALVELFAKSIAFAESSIAQYGANATLPGRMVRLEGELQYFIQPPDVNHFTWDVYDKVTGWLFWYFIFGGTDFACAFGLRKVEDGEEQDIGYGGVRMLTGEDRSRAISSESL